ncbi:unnamed protein product [Ixodes pacificus]
MQFPHKVRVHRNQIRKNWSVCSCALPIAPLPQRPGISAACLCIVSWVSVGKTKQASMHIFILGRNKATKWYSATLVPIAHQFELLLLLTCHSNLVALPAF